MGDGWILGGPRGQIATTVTSVTPLHGLTDAQRAGRAPKVLPGVHRPSWLLSDSCSQHELLPPRAPLPCAVAAVRGYRAAGAVLV